MVPQVGPQKLGLPGGNSAYPGGGKRRAIVSCSSIRRSCRRCSGTRSITLTIDTYSHVLPGMQEESVARLDRLALKPPGERYATTNPDIAIKLLADRLSDLEQRKRDKILFGREKTATIAEYASHHLRLKESTGSRDSRSRSRNTFLLQPVLPTSRLS